ncbi:hypothetical protein AKJ41_05220 [candidate division MSBL1 archaeon SCGC-AAA259O05]|uniref:Histone deacetylase domain-containing protein n=1 Tax=candidate division MSBL1 archaeon SCGC-AAA259O05 TaxID=1698271 RepID=A0A133UZH8_9EURY|nr:hypothetical protein AKJ41_05220 [candidate division MSBL1 archaeon SCGC-AAA259O05]
MDTKKKDFNLYSLKKKMDTNFIERRKKWKMEPRVRDHEPEILVHFFGHDTHRDDYGNRGLSESFFPKLAKLMRDFADEICDGKYLLIDGGGANTEVGERIWPDIIEILADY